ncbi:DUF4227 family protein [Paenibacillus caui]|uniref:DUF4227 family protein n=1 Tax=Paenibacillus caui TaxID=2873927 RepID=UPI001CA9A86C|nr:DUF4227 family protein [Paenibacillus caui]
MVISLRKWLRSLRYLLVFLVLVYVFSKLFGLFESWLSPSDPYHNPEGTAVKAGGTPVLGDDKEGLLERLKIYYRLGE